MVFHLSVTSTMKFGIQLIIYVFLNKFYILELEPFSFFHLLIGRAVGIVIENESPQQYLSTSLRLLTN